MTRGRLFLSLVAAIAVLGAVLWYVTAPPKGKDGYLERVASTSETVRSQVQTARIWAETHADEQATSAAALVGLEEAERDAHSALSEFEAYEPPSGTLVVRSELERLAGDATTRLSKMRIAAQLEEWSTVARLATGLAPLAEELGRLEERTRP